MMHDDSVAYGYEGTVLTHSFRPRRLGVQSVLFRICVIPALSVTKPTGRPITKDFARGQQANYFHFVENSCRVFQ
jgi:hypothetical protein